SGFCHCHSAAKADDVFTAIENINNNARINKPRLLIIPPLFFELPINNI
ncbi:hypothetical protein LCGC14_3014060, partial [marine sediment metagenome]